VATPLVERSAPVESARCLVVDDDPMVRRTLSRVLQHHGMAVLEAQSGEEALALLAPSAVPLVITDLYMPGMDGLTLLREITRRHPDTAVLVLTGVAEVRTAIECLQLGALDYLSKPILAEEVRTRVGNALETRRLALENRWLQQSYQARLESRVRELVRRNQEMFLVQIQLAVRTFEAKEAHTRGHSRRVALYATRTAVQLGLAGAVLDQVRLGAELHDTGKIGIRDAVLSKPGPLQPEEFEEVRRHVLEGEEILAPLRKGHPAVLQIVRHHHEHVDGTGFPDGLRGDAIPLVARIVSVADAFDAMTTPRAYRPPRSIPSAVEELNRCAGTQFDPKVVDAFHRAFPDPSHLPVQAA
jgi:response regulator RpfG family c-di-GMP phosphodiesterase